MTTREKKYEGVLSPTGWLELINLAKRIFGDIESVTGTVCKENGIWTHDTLADTITDLNPHDTSIYISFSDYEKVRLQCFNNFGWLVQSVEKEKILEFETRAEIMIREHLLTVENPPTKLKSPTIFIGHGRDTDWRDLKDHLQDKHDFTIEAYEIGSRSGHTIRDVLDDMLKSSDLAVLVHTPEDEQADGSFNSRPNVIHETGLFQGKLGFPRAILLLKDGANEFSNVYGVQQIRYKSINQTYGDILAWVRRETK